LLQNPTINYNKSTQMLTDLSYSGLMALPRSPLHGPSEIEEKDAEDVVDQSTLPPG
jgi:hypothetical protein